MVDHLDSKCSKFFQNTLKDVLVFHGIGVHSGRPVEMTLRPSSIQSGIIFKRLDLTDYPEIPAKWSHVTETDFCTRISNKNNVSVSTIEHIMAALAMCDIDNVLITLDGPEIPIMDGSSQIFIDNIHATGLHQQSTPKHFIKILKPVKVTVSDTRYAVLEPADIPSISYQMDFIDRSNMIPQKFYHEGHLVDFSSQVAMARTYGFIEDVERMRAAGLGLGGSLDNAVIIDQGQAINPQGFRWNDECVRHKVLDAIGDLYLAGAPILGAYASRNGGHGLNNQLLTALMNDATSWRYDQPILNNF